ncbi:DEAD/DEAH box helicase family protein [Brugia pahangi]
MSLLSSDSMCGFLLRQIRKVDLCRVWVARCSSSQVIASSKPSKDRRKDVDDVISPQQPQSDFRVTSGKPSSWIDVNREEGRQPGTFRSRNIGLDRFFDTQRRHERLTARDQWARRNVLSDRYRNSGGSWNKDVEMPKVDYKHLNLPPIQKNLYKENPSVTDRSEKEIVEWFTHNEVTLKGNSSPRPIFEFSETGFPPAIIEKLKKACFEKPTVIQSISWPVALTGHDMISIARTGSGKTLAYTLPGIVHMQNQEQPEKVRGPAVLILAPTRELVQQISSMAMNFHSKIACAYGGSGRDQQARTIREGVDILAAAPVLDEADRMLDMGFEPQIRRIVSMIRPDRQTLMFSATWPKEVRTLAKDFLSDPVFVNVGSLKLAANSNIIQMVTVVEENEKEEKLLEFLNRTSSEQHCKTLIFVGMKRTADWLTRLIRKKGYPALSLHGDKSQTERNFVMNDFKNGECSILVATDVAARGLDVNDIKYVINFDCPKNIEDYIHRIGRTARHDKTGTSYTLCTRSDAPIVNELVSVLKEAKQTVPSDLLDLVSRHPTKSSRKRF